ncbi:MAG TPA: chromate resistance protein ChrB domain-containing protein [Rubrobacter sp.]|nr:chromate resistance protein ChrB domain-containing protein [Rubrobacter sp.]
MLWATRRGCHVDRTACIWLIRRRIDPDAEFSFFVDASEAPEGAELFDVAGARLSHRGDACSFETMLEEYDLDDTVLREISEIVHDADLMDDMYGRSEADGLDAVIRGMQLALPDDNVLSVHTDIIFDGLYAYLWRETL